MMRIIDVALLNGSYRVYIGDGSYGRLLKDLKNRGGRVYLVADSNAMAHHSHVILDAIPGEPAGMFFIAGEKEKNMETVSKILEDAAKSGITRSDCFVSFGGGVCGDVTGFCAAIFMRGIDYYQVPTTLLSQVDSSIGGKTGVDLESGKNLAGAFKQPSGVYINTGVLRTLSESELNQGKAEMIKHALIADSGLLDKYESGEIVTEENIARNIEIKLSFVKGDETDLGKRMMLNFGHTIAHAIETKAGYGKISHGEAVAIGMSVENELAEKAGLSPVGSTGRIKKVLESAGLPVETEYSPVELIDIMKKDKKTMGGKLNAVILEEIGRAGLKLMTIEQFASQEG
jgi:3-dehydroquinate synthase